MANQKSVKIESDVSPVEVIKSGLNDLTIPEIRDIIDYACEIIKSREDEELAELDRRIAELEAKRQQLRPQSVQVVLNGKKREIKALINPKNPEQKYTVGLHPQWLKDWLKETLGEKSEDKVAVWNQISQWKNAQ